MTGAGWTTYTAEFYRATGGQFLLHPGADHHQPRGAAVLAFLDHIQTQRRTAGRYWGRRSMT